MTAGRPEFKITDEVCAKAEKLAAQGLTGIQIASVLGMGDRTFYEKKAKYSQFSQAIDAGRAKGIASVTNALFKKANEGDVAAQKYYLNNRDNVSWKDRVHSEVKSEISGEIRVSDLTDHALNERILEIERLANAGES